MPTTTGGLALPYPAPSDAPSGPYALQQLAERVEAALATTDRPRCQVTNAAAPSIANATTVALSWDTETVDVGNMHVAGSSQIKATKAGLYLITANVEYAAFSTGYARAQFRYNGVTYGAGTVIDANSATINLSISAQWQAALNDYVELTLFQNTGAAKSLVIADHGCRMAATWLCP